MMRLGMNLTPPHYYSKDLPFLDRMKCAGDWAGPVLAMDENGWPAAIGGRITAQIPMIDQQVPHTLRWQGKGTFKLSKNFKPTASGEGWLTVVTGVEPGEKTSNQLIVTATDVADPLRNMSVVETRYDARHQAGEILDPDFVDGLRGYGQIRFMDWLRTNEQAPDAKNVPPPAMAQRSWMWGVPLNVCLDLAKGLGARAWVNIPCLASDDQIEAFGLACPSDADIEWSNEATWNTGFAQGKWSDAQAKAAGISRAVWAGRQHVRVAKLLERVGRKLVVGYQPTGKATGWDEYGAVLIEAGATSRNVSRVMTTCYPTGGINSLAKITPFMAADDVAGAAALIRQDAIDNSGARFAVAKALADKLGVPWSVYEGNVAHLNTSAGSDTAVPFVTKVQMHPGMREIGEIILAEAEKHGCDVFNVFNYSSLPTRNGFFGVKGTPFGALLDERRPAAEPEPEPLTLESIDRRLRAVEARLA